MMSRSNWRPRFSTIRAWSPSPTSSTVQLRTVLSVVYMWSEADPVVIKIRLISARKATQAEFWQYGEGL